jgi:sugar lactone lactonase YvrE
MHAHQVIQVSDKGEITPVIRVENQPSGLGWLPDGSLLVVSMLDRRLLRWDGKALTEHADLSALARWHCNDMVVDGEGRAWVGNFGFDLHSGAPQAATELICVGADGVARIVADDLMFPNGMVITPDGKTLVVAETFASRLTAFDIDPRGELKGRRLNLAN